MEVLDEEAVYRCPMYRLLEDALYAGSPCISERSDCEAEQANDANDAPRLEIAGMLKVDGSC